MPDRVSVVRILDHRCLLESGGGQIVAAANGMLLAERLMLGGAMVQSKTIADRQTIRAALHRLGWDIPTNGGEVERLSGGLSGSSDIER